MDVHQLQPPLPPVKPNLPDGFPAPPIGYELIFAHWAGIWRRHYSIRPISFELHVALQRFVAGIAAPDIVAFDMAKSALAAAHHHLVTAQARVSSSQHELFLATGLATRVDWDGANISASDYESRLEEARAHVRHASDTLSRVQAAYDIAKSVYTTEKDAYNTRTTAYYAQIELIYCALGIEALARQANQPNVELEMVLKPISLVAIPDRVVPSPYEENHDRMHLQVDCDHASLVAARGFQRDMLRRHPDLCEFRVKIGQVGVIKYGITSRDLPNSKAAVDYFTAEMEPRIRLILQVSKPNAQFWVISGAESSRVDLFLIVDASNQAGQRVCCSVAVIFTMPYPFADERDGTSTSVDCPDWAVYSELPSEAYGHRILRQVYDYLKDGSTMGPLAVCGTVSQDVAIWSTYNDTWIIRSMDTCDSATTLPADMPAAGTNIMLTISTRFSATNADPHIAFVYAKVLDEIIRDMQDCSEDNSTVSEVQSNTDPTPESPAAVQPDHNMC
ncbi:hypothetical protein GGI03_002039 [Coemansia sp. RSA 2337]|nr:hypothetical protein GGH13_005126 [Coemansia sp. S155-1]KAJ2466569.1 hypothetical protein GGI03_002039 [Coemansia sp. RSA 2337]